MANKSCLTLMPLLDSLWISLSQVMCGISRRMCRHVRCQKSVRRQCTHPSVRACINNAQWSLCVGVLPRLLCAKAPRGDRYLMPLLFCTQNAATYAHRKSPEVFPRSKPPVDELSDGGDLGDDYAAKVREKRRGARSSFLLCRLVWSNMYPQKYTHCHNEAIV